MRSERLGPAEMPPGLNLFPLGVATGAAHCNRADERSALKRNILAGIHTWLWSRRRMGKTSLIEQTLQDLARSNPEVVAGTCDLLVIHDPQGFEAQLRSAIERLGSRLAGEDAQATGKLAEAFQALKPEFSFGALGLRLRLSAPDQPAQGIAEALLGLDRAAGMQRRRVALAFDEFQQLGALKPESGGASLEGAVRHAAERAEHITYLFAGSEKHLLAAMFEDAQRPLYRLCRKIPLDRIGSADYLAFLQQAAEIRWSKPIEESAIKRILAATARHPYYVNALCGRLWLRARPPTPETASAAWSRIVEEDRRVVVGPLARLAPTQRALLRAVAQAEDGVAHPTSHRFLAPLRLPTSSGGRAKEALERDDLIRQDENGHWTLVDPVMASYLRAL